MPKLIKKQDLLNKLDRPSTFERVDFSLQIQTPDDMLTNLSISTELVSKNFSFKNNLDDSALIENSNILNIGQIKKLKNDKLKIQKDSFDGNAPFFELDDAIEKVSGFKKITQTNSSRKIINKLKKNKKTSKTGAGSASRAGTVGGY